MNTHSDEPNSKKQENCSHNNIQWEVTNVNTDDNDLSFIMEATCEDCNKKWEEEMTILG